MEELLKSLADHAPNLVALIIVVGLFLRYISKRDQENTDERIHSREIIERNTEAIGRNSQAMNDAARIMQDLVIKWRRE